jgi:hypothetical protein
MPTTIGPLIDNEDAVRLNRIYDAVSKNIERENTLINFRVLWAIFLSAGIIATETFVVTFVEEHYPDKSNYLIGAQLIVLVLSALAGIFCYMSARGVQAAQSQMSDVKRSYHLQVEHFNTLGYPRPFGDKTAHRTGNYNAIVYPIALTTLWAVLVAVQIFRLLEISLTEQKPQYDLSKDQQVKQSIDKISTTIGGLGEKLDALKPPPKK